MTTSDRHEDPGRKYAGENQHDRQARRRQQFLDAGLAVIGSQGYRAATVRTLCKHAGLTDRYFYESFDTMEDLLVAVYQQQIEVLRRAVMAALLAHAQGGDSFTEAISGGLNAVFTQVRDRCLARVVWLEVLGVSPRVDAMYNDTIRGFGELVVQVARARLPDLNIEDDEARVLGIAAVGAVSQTVVHWLLSDYRERQSVMVSATSRVFRGLLSTLPN